MSRIEPISARKELLRYLRLGKSIRLRGGESHVRNFILETQSDPAIRRLCLAYQLNVSDLTLACKEVLAERPDLIRPDEIQDPLPIRLFTEPGELEGFLDKLHRATHGQTEIHRPLAIVTCAKLRAAQMAGRVSRPRPVATRSNLLKKSLFNNLFLMLLVAVLILVGILIVVALR